MDIGICSYSFHRQLASGKQDIFGFITLSRELGCTQLDPWNAHLALIKLGEGAGAVGPELALSGTETDYLARIEAAADESGLPWGTLVVDGAHIYDADETVRAANRARAYRWLEVADRLGCEQVRIDAGGPEDMPDDVFKVIVEGYNDLIARAKEKDIEVITENHFGPSRIPANVERMMNEIEGLGFLYDTHNWKPELLAEGRQRTAKYATATHVKTFAWDEQGNETSGTSPEEAVRLLLDAGYTGAWGVESVPTDGDEVEGARKSVAMIHRVAG
ncbi:MAG TPA: TIM barrel protein [Tepidisphaeraceae bacterium]|nr:TIM barrel protein [Tepidisphaeraceae bacterium]